MYKEFHNKLPNIVCVKYVKKYTRYNYKNDKLFHIKMSKLNTKIKYLYISGCILGMILFIYQKFNNLVFF